MDIKYIEDFISSKYEIKNTQIKVKSYVKKGISIFENAGILEPSENDFSIIEDKSVRSYTRAFYNWYNSWKDVQKEPSKVMEKKYSIRKRNINFLLDDERYKIVSIITLQNDTTITDFLNVLIDKYFSENSEKIERIKKFLND